MPQLLATACQNVGSFDETEPFSYRELLAINLHCNLFCFVCLFVFCLFNSIFAFVSASNSNKYYSVMKHNNICTDPAKDTNLGEKGYK